MINLFSSVVVEEDAIRARIPGKGWREIVSINGVPIERIRALAEEQFPDTYEEELNVLLPRVMDMTDSPLAGDVEVIAREVNAPDEQGSVYALHYDAAKRGALTDSLRKIFEGTVAIGKVASLSEEEINALFVLSMHDCKKGDDEPYMDATDIIGHMMNNAGEMGNMNAANCESQ